jgi:ribonuclease D
MLKKRADFEPADFIELQEMVGEYGIQDMSLQKLYANIFGQKISKSQRLSNWEADILTEQQKLYAATDAWACVMLYQELLNMKQEGFELEIVPEPEPVVPKEGDPDAPKKEKKRKARSKNTKDGRKRKGYTYHRKSKKKNTENKEIIPNE